MQKLYKGSTALGLLALIFWHECQHTIYVTLCFAKRRNSVIAIHGIEPGIARRDDALQRPAAVAIPVNPASGLLNDLQALEYSIIIQSPKCPLCLREGVSKPAAGPQGMLFAHMKRNFRFTRLKLRGLAGAAEEFLLLATVQNLRRLARLRPPNIPLTQYTATA